MPTSSLSQTNSGKSAPKTRTLTPEHIQRINQFLAEMGDYGEIRLIVQRGELRYINTVESYKFDAGEATR